MLLTYYTVKGYGEHEQIVQKSRFIAYVQRAETEKEAHAFIQAIKKKHHDASHNCSAYLIGEKDDFQKASDDGEPSGTAGVPILEVLRKKQLKNTVVVVTRYFGGTKLGAGGLIRAYGKAVSEGLNASGIVKRTRMIIVCFYVDYTLIGKIENELKNALYKIKDISYLESVGFQVYVRVDKEEAFVDWITNVSNGKATFEDPIKFTFLEETITMDES